MFALLAVRPSRHSGVRFSPIATLVPADARFRFDPSPLRQADPSRGLAPVPPSRVGRTVFCVRTNPAGGFPRRRAVADSGHGATERVAAGSESFLAPSAAVRLRTDDATQLYHPDIVVAIDASRGLNNGQPSGLAAWLQALELRRGDRVLHIGCGLGYYTAIIAAVVAPHGEVIGVELDAGLASRAGANLMSVKRVSVVAGDGCELIQGQ